jgi:hypothetical protein
MLGYRVGQSLVERLVEWWTEVYLTEKPQKAKNICSLFVRFTIDRPRFTDTLDVVKFICKDLWVIMFKKQVDNLKTNHRVRIVAGAYYWVVEPPCVLTDIQQGVYVLQDNNFRWFMRMSTDIGGTDSSSKATPVSFFEHTLIFVSSSDIYLNSTCGSRVEWFGVLLPIWECLVRSWPKHPTFHNVSYIVYFAAETKLVVLMLLPSCVSLPRVSAQVRFKSKSPNHKYVFGLCICVCMHYIDTFICAPILVS